MLAMPQAGHSPPGTLFIDLGCELNLQHAHPIETVEARWIASNACASYKDGAVYYVIDAERPYLHIPLRLDKAFRRAHREGCQHIAFALL